MVVSKNKRSKQDAATANNYVPRMVLMLLVLGLTLLGFVMIYSASSIEAISKNKDASIYLLDQLKFAAIGLAGAFIVWKVIPFRMWQGPLLWLFWGGCIVLLIMTAAMGTSEYGAQRWVNVGPISLQPSEFAKIAFILVASYLYREFDDGSIDLKHFAIAFAVMVIAPIGLLYFSQSDLGTTAIIALGLIGVMWFGEVPVRVIVLVVLALLLFAVLAIFTSGYRTNRMLYLNPWEDGEGGFGAGYQIIHSFYAFAEGGIFGVGLGNSREKYLYIPESETDFIYAIIGEELGMIGALSVIIAFLVLLWAGLSIARSCREEFARMTVGALTIMLVFQAFLNIGCVIGVFPTTGKPLPFVSSGGSSLIATFMMIGLILAASDSEKKEKIQANKDREKKRDNLRVLRNRNS